MCSPSRSAAGSPLRRSCGRPCSPRWWCSRSPPCLRAPLVVAACALAVAGWWWGSERLQSLDRSVLASDASARRSAPSSSSSEPPRRGRFETRVRALVVRWGGERLHEPVLLELPAGRAPPQGARLSVLGVLRAPRGPSNGFDERAWLRRHGVHVVLHADAWRRIGRRAGLGGRGRPPARVARARRSRRASAGSAARDRGCRARRGPGPLGRAQAAVPRLRALPPAGRERRTSCSSRRARSALAGSSGSRGSRRSSRCSLRSPRTCSPSGRSRP